MPRGDKSGNPKMKRHRAALRVQKQNRIATTAMEREYAPKSAHRGHSPTRCRLVSQTRHDGPSKLGEEVVGQVLERSNLAEDCAEAEGVTELRDRAGHGTQEKARSAL